MSNNYTRWYREGTVSVTQNSTSVTGTDTLWSAAGLKPGDMFSIDNMTEYEIDIINDNTHLTLKTAYTGAAASGVKYRIIRNFSASSNADVAGMAAELMHDFADYINSDMKTLTGKSAYKEACDNGFVGTQQEWLDSLTAYGAAKKNGYTGTLAQWLETLTAYGVAVQNGYTGTKAQWLESLKAAGEWTKASDRLTTLETIADPLSLNPDINTQFSYLDKHRRLYYIYRHTQSIRFKNLGDKPTDAQLKAIREWPFGDFYLGDYWETEMDITYPILNGADPANGDTFENEDGARYFKGTVRWYIVDMFNIAFDETVLVLMGMNINSGCCKADGTMLGGLCQYPMNYKDSTECGYRYSLVKDKALPAIYNALKTTWNLSDDNLASGPLGSRAYTASRTTVAASGTPWPKLGDEKSGIDVPTVGQLFGGLNTVNLHKSPVNYQVNWETQFALFRLCPYATRIFYNTWLMDMMADVDKFVSSDRGDHGVNLFLRWDAKATDNKPVLPLVWLRGKARS